MSVTTGLPMTITNNNYPRGSEWRIWDLHIHSPASFFWEGEKFNGNQDHDAMLVDQMIEALNQSDVSVFSLMDYWTFDGWFKLQERLTQAGAPKLEKTVFPGIELRLSAPMRGRLNAHVIFSNEINQQYLKDFLSTLRLEFIDKPLSNNSLREYARYVGEDHLISHGYSKQKVDTDDDIALEVGYKIAELKVESYVKAISEIPDGLGLGYMPFTTNDGLSQIERNKHYAYALSLFQNSPIFETRDKDTWAAFAGVETEGNKGFIENFQKALNNVPRLAIAGSDAHKFKSKQDSEMSGVSTNVTDLGLG